MDDLSLVIESLLIETAKNYYYNNGVSDNTSLGFLLPDVLIPVEYHEGIVSFGSTEAGLTIYKIGIHVVCFGPSVLISIPGMDGAMGYACSVIPSSVMISTGELLSSDEIAEVTKRFYISVNAINNTNIKNSNKNLLH